MTLEFVWDFRWNSSSSIVVDHDLHQVRRWFKDVQSGEILFGGHGHQANQFAYPIGIDFDPEGNLHTNKQYPTSGVKDKEIISKLI